MSSTDITTFLSSYKLDRSPINHRPRGLFTNGKNSFLNCIVQSVLHIAQIFNLLNGLRDVLDASDERVGITRAFSELAKFEDDLSEQEKITGPSFYLRIVRVTKLLHKVVADAEAFFQLDYEEDPGKFLVYILNSMKYELYAACSKPNFINPISEIFQGSIIEVKQATKKRKEKPFFVLKLDIASEQITNIGEALVQHFNVTGRKKSFDTLPEVLILQLRLFSCDDETGDMEKLNKIIHPSKGINIPEKILSEEAIEKYSSIEKSYIFSSAIYHQGENVNNGHYTSFVDHDSLGLLVYEDDVVIPFHKGGSGFLAWRKHPYLMMYRRKDTIAAYSEPLSMDKEMEVSPEGNVEYMDDSSSSDDSSSDSSSGSESD